VIAFDLIDVCRDAELAGFDRGYIVGLTDAEPLTLELREKNKSYTYDLEYF
jgi:hypothetical protein